MAEPRPVIKIASRALHIVGFRPFNGDPTTIFPENRHELPDFQHKYIVIGYPKAYPYEKGEPDTVRRLRNGDSNRYEAKVTTNAYSSRLLSAVGPDHLEFRWGEYLKYRDNDDLAVVITVAVGGPERISEPIVVLTSDISPLDYNVPFRRGIAIADENQVRELVRSRRQRAV